ncbi:MAG: hypothetical protein V2G41_10310 [bacterium JZ-2024 1]
MSEIVLYPSNWLYNAGVIGLLRVLESTRETVPDLLSDDGTIKGNELIDRIKALISTEKATFLPKPLDELPLWHWNYVKLSFEWNYGNVRNLVTEIFQRAQRVTNRTQLRDQLTCKKFAYEDRAVDFKETNRRIADLFGKAFGRNPALTINQAIDEIVRVIEIQKDAYIFRKGIGYLFSQGGFYQNLFNPSWFSDLGKFIKFFTEEKIFETSTSGSGCGFCSGGDFKVEPIDATQMSFLFPVFSQFPNAYWQNNKTAVTQICSLCKFIIIHHHLALTRLFDGSEIFINAPSFKVMYYLNKFACEAFGASLSTEARTKREILTMSVIEYATKIQTTLGVWTGMNIEVVSRRGDKIEFFSLPYEVIQLLADRRIASVLSQIGEFTILNLVLNQDFSRLMELGYRLLRIGLKTYAERGESENRFVYDNLILDKNRRSPQQVAERIFQLCALIEEKRKRRETYEYVGIT